MNQLSLSFQLNTDWLAAYIEKASGRTVTLYITDNSSIVLTMMQGDAAVKLRLHRIFLSASDDVLAEIARYVKNNTIKTPLVRKFIDDNVHRLKKSPPRHIRLRHWGRYHNLLDIFNALNREYFRGNIQASITWGALRPKQRIKTNTLGSYCYKNKIIRINPRLDSKLVPLYYLKYIVYHEMLHADIGVEFARGRNAYHTEEFRRREKLFREYERAQAREARN